MTINTKPPKWNKGAVKAWWALISVAVVYELFSLLDLSSATPPLTEVVTTIVPGFLIMGFLSWLYVHWGKTYVFRWLWENRESIPKKFQKYIKNPN
jgi:hypothetical protein